MMMKIKVFTLANKTATLKCIGSMKGEAGESLADLQVCLEEK